jgi:RHS repeat-associated protein
MRLCFLLFLLLCGAAAPGHGWTHSGESGDFSAVTAYAYDELGNQTQQTDALGRTTRYDYDASGVLLRHEGTSENAYLYCGEQWDQDLGLYFLRARFMNPDSGRFWNMDTFEGARGDQASLHKYLYASANPVMGSDPSGYFTLFEVTLVQVIDGIKNAISVPVSAYARRKGIKTLTCVVGVSAAERWMDYEFSVEGHHPIPKSHGGAEDQILLFLPASTHRAFHFIYNVFLKGNKEFAALGLHNSSPAADWEEAFKRNPALKRVALRLLKQAARVIDKKCGLPKALGLETFITKNQRRWLRGG